MEEALDNPVELWNIPWNTDTRQQEAPPPGTPQLPSLFPEAPEAPEASEL